MSWRDNFNNAQGKFRDAEFVIETDGLEFGRRTQVHEYPLRDHPFVEDLGRKARKFSFTCFVVGPNYMVARDKLIHAIEQPGPGVLEHPYFGTLNVDVIEARKNESTREGGMATFNLTVIESGEKSFEFVATDTAAEVVASAEETELSALDEFANVFSVIGQVQEFVDGVVDEIEDALQAVEDVVNGITGPITDLIRAPFELGSAIVGALSNLENSFNNPLRALSLYEDLFDSGADSQPIPTTTSSRIKQASNVAAVHTLIQRTAIAEACRLTSTIAFQSVDNALAQRDVLLEAIDDQVEQTTTQPVIDSVYQATQPVTDSVYQAMQTLRTTVAEDLRIRGAQLPRITLFNTEAELPAVVIAHRLYGDADRDAEIIARNKIRHPGFVPGGQALQVLTNV